MHLIVGSRGSALALWQARYVSDQLQALGVETRIEIIKTTGDRMQSASLELAGGKGLFTKEIENALLAGEIDLAVHSLKDLPTENPAGLTIAATPVRENPFDALVGARLTELRPGATVGTSSPRRAAQLKLLRADLVTAPIRGNVDTRLRKLKSGEFAAILLAAAGLRRLGLESEIAQLFGPHEICPAPGQGALAIQTRTASEAETICARLNDADTHQAVRAERTVLAALEAGCQLPVGAYAEPRGNDLHLMAVVAAPSGKTGLRAERTGPAQDPELLGKAVAADLLAQGADRLLAEG